MKNVSMSLLLALMGILLTSTASAGVYDDACNPGEDPKACLERVYGSFLETTMRAEAEAAQLRQAQAKAVTSGNGALVARLQAEVKAKDVEIVALRKERDELKSKVEALSGQVASLSGQVTDLNAKIDRFLEAQTEKSVAKSETPAPGPTLADYRPELDQGVYGRMGYRNHRPEIPNPVDFPDMRWEQSGNCLTVINKKQGVDGWLFLRIAGVTRILDATGQVIANDVPLGPGDEYYFCASDNAPRMMITPAMRSTAPLAVSYWSDVHHRHIPLQKSEDRIQYINEWFGDDRIFELR